MPVNFRKNAAVADLNLTLQGYEFDHETRGNWLNFPTTLRVASRGRHYRVAAEGPTSTLSNF